MREREKQKTSVREKGKGKRENFRGYEENWTLANY